MARRKRWMRQPLSWQRGGAVALAVLVAVMVAALALDSEGEADLEPVVSYLEERGREPAALVESIGRTSRLVLLSDIPGLAAPKRVAAEAIEALAKGPGLDAVVLEVSSEEQGYIDAYLNAVEEDATVLLGRPAAVQEWHGVPREFLEIYRTVYRLNREVGAARRIRIIAADAPDWPPSEGLAGELAAQSYASRADHMVRRMEDELLARMPEARMLVFVDGYMTLKQTHGQARFAGGDPVEIEWLGARLREAVGREVRTILLDAGDTMREVRRLPSYHGTAFHRSLRRELGGDRGVRVDDTFSVLTDPVLEASSPALRLDIVPDTYTLRDVADGYIFLSGAR